MSVFQAITKLEISKKRYVWIFLVKNAGYRSQKIRVFFKRRTCYFAVAA